MQSVVSIFGNNVVQDKRAAKKLLITNLHIGVWVKIPKYLHVRCWPVCCGCQVSSLISHSASAFHSIFRPIHHQMARLSFLPCVLCISTPVHLNLNISRSYCSTTCGWCGLKYDYSSKVRQKLSSPSIAVFMERAPSTFCPLDIHGTSRGLI